MSQIIIRPTCMMTYIADDAGVDSNFGLLNRTRVGCDDKGGQKFRTLIRVDLGVIGAATIDIADTSKLELYTFDTNNGPTSTVKYWMYRVTQPWTEEGATWNKYDGVTAWANPGGDYSADTPTPVSSEVLDDDEAPAFMIWGAGGDPGADDLMTKFLQDAITSRSGILDIIIISESEELLTWNEYESDNTTVAARIPKLTIDYTGGDVPDLASIFGWHNFIDVEPFPWTCVKTIMGEPVNHVKSLIGEPLH